MIIRYGYDFNNCIYYALLDDNTLITALTIMELTQLLDIDSKALRDTHNRADILKF